MEQVKKETLDKLKEVQDLKERLSRDGVKEVTPLGGRGLDVQLRTLRALTEGTGSEIKDRMEKPREIAAVKAERDFNQRRETVDRERTGRVSVRITKVIPKKKNDGAADNTSGNTAG